MNKNYLLIILLFVYCVGFSQYKVINVKEPLRNIKEADFSTLYPKFYYPTHYRKKINKYKGPFSTMLKICWVLTAFKKIKISIQSAILTSYWAIKLTYRKHTMSITRKNKRPSVLPIH